jgi:hypothetical protein
MEACNIAVSPFSSLASDGLFSLFFYDGALSSYQLGPRLMLVGTQRHLDAADRKLFRPCQKLNYGRLGLRKLSPVIFNSPLPVLATVTFLIAIFNILCSTVKVTENVVKHTTNTYLVELNIYLN